MVFHSESHLHYSSLTSLGGSSLSLMIPGFALLPHSPSVHNEQEKRQKKKGRTSHAHRGVGASGYDHADTFSLTVNVQRTRRSATPMQDVLHIDENFIFDNPSAVMTTLLVLMTTNCCYVQQSTSLGEFSIFLPFHVLTTSLLTFYSSRCITITRHSLPYLMPKSSVSSSAHNSSTLPCLQPQIALPLW